MYANALDLSLKNSDRVNIDVIIVETHAQSSDAIDLIQRLRQRFASPILLVATSNDETYFLQAYQAGADECISSRASDALLRAKVRAWMRWTSKAMHSAKSRPPTEARHRRSVEQTKLVSR